MKPYCIRCGKDGHVYPVRYTEPNNNQVYCWNLCHKCAHEHHLLMEDWWFRTKTKKEVGE